MERTNKYKRLKNLFFFLSTFIWLATAATFVIMALIKTNNVSTVESDVNYISEDLKELILGFSTTIVIAIVGTVLIKDKTRNTIWMGSLVLGLLVAGEGAIYCTLILWALDEFVIYLLYKRYKNKYIINKEIDLRG